MTLRIVGEDEFDLAQGWISLNSPVARALLGKESVMTLLLIGPQGKFLLRYWTSAMRGF